MPDVQRSPAAAFIEAGLTVIENLTYTEKTTDSLSMDCFFDGRTPSPRPALVWIHGGGCVEPEITRLNRPTEAFIELCRRGWFIASIDYHLAQDIPFPSQVRDSKCAVRFLRANAERLGLDPERVCVWGESCGGQIAALLAVKGGIPDFEGEGWDGVSSDIRAAVAWYGGFDTLSFTNLLNDPKFTVIYGGTLEEKRELVIKGSPITYAAEKLCPILAMCSDTDVRVPNDQTVRFCKLLREHGNRADYIIVPNQGHGYFKGQEYYEKIYDFLESCVK